MNSENEIVPPGVPVAPQKHSQWLTVVGVCQIGWGSFLALATLALAFMVYFGLGQHSYEEIIGSGIHSFVWIGIGIGTLKRKRWAQRLVRYLALAMILTAIIGWLQMIPFYTIFSNLLSEADTFMKPFLIFGLVMAFGMGLISGMFIPIFFLWFYNLKTIAAAFVAQGTTPDACEDVSDRWPDVVYLILAFSFVLPPFFLYQSKSNAAMDQVDKMFSQGAFSGKYSRLSDYGEIHWQDEFAPNFTLPVAAGLEAKEFHLADYVGKKTIILSFFTTWCGPCKAEIPELNEFYETNRNDVLLVGVNQQENRTKVEGFVKRRDVKFPVILDDKAEVGGRYGVRSYPTTVVIGVNGRIRLYERGRIFDTKKKFAPSVKQDQSLIETGGGLKREEFLAHSSLQSGLSLRSKKAIRPENVEYVGDFERFQAPSDWFVKEASQKSLIFDGEDFSVMVPKGLKIDHHRNAGEWHSFTYIFPINKGKDEMQIAVGLDAQKKGQGMPECQVLEFFKASDFTEKNGRLFGSHFCFDKKKKVVYVVTTSVTKEKFTDYQDSIARVLSSIVVR